MDLPTNIMRKFEVAPIAVRFAFISQANNLANWL